MHDIPYFVRRENGGNGEQETSDLTQHRLLTKCAEVRGSPQPKRIKLIYFNKIL